MNSFTVVTNLIMGFVCRNFLKIGRGGGEVREIF
jgi:hypothetical protein